LVRSAPAGRRCVSLETWLKEVAGKLRSLGLAAGRERWPRHMLLIDIFGLPRKRTDRDGGHERQGC
jgi:hypothetical protein